MSKLADFDVTDINSSAKVTDTRSLVYTTNMLGELDTSPWACIKGCAVRSSWCKLEASATSTGWSLNTKCWSSNVLLAIVGATAICGWTQHVKAWAALLLSSCHAILLTNGILFALAMSATAKAIWDDWQPTIAIGRWLAGVEAKYEAIRCVAYVDSWNHLLRGLIQPNKPSNLVMRTCCTESDVVSTTMPRSVVNGKMDPSSSFLPCKMVIDWLTASIARWKPAAAVLPTGKTPRTNISYRKTQQHKA